MEESKRRHTHNEVRHHRSHRHSSPEHSDHRKNLHNEPVIKQEKRSRDEDDQHHNSESKVRRQRNSNIDGDRRLGEESQDWGKREVKKEQEKTEPKQKPSMELSGKLTEDTNTYNGIVIKYSQPPEARKPKRRWRWYIFKGDEELPYLPLHRQSAYLIGRDRKVVDIPTDHPSCSKQHAVLQYRLVSYQKEDRSTGRTVKPYILDLDSANGTYVNNRRMEPKRYIELMEKDVVKFGFSTREYILLHEGSHDEDLSDGGQELSPVTLLRSK